MFLLSFKLLQSVSSYFQACIDLIHYIPQREKANSMFALKSNIRINQLEEWNNEKTTWNSLSDVNWTRN